MEVGRVNLRRIKKYSTLNGFYTFYPTRYYKCDEIRGGEMGCMCTRDEKHVQNIC
jgi:hypothetical protein